MPIKGDWVLSEGSYKDEIINRIKRNKELIKMEMDEEGRRKKVLNKNFVCKTCGNSKVVFYANGRNPDMIAARCSRCNHFIKWISKSEKNFFKDQLPNSAKVSNKKPAEPFIVYKKIY